METLGTATADLFLLAGPPVSQTVQAHAGEKELMFCVKCLRTTCSFSKQHDGPIEPTNRGVRVLTLGNGIALPAWGQQRNIIAGGQGSLPNVPAVPGDFTERP
ncbi:hypothetical protein GCM10022290_44660 [Sagittula marina]